MAIIEIVPGFKPTAMPEEETVAIVGFEPLHRAVLVTVVDTTSEYVVVALQDNICCFLD